MKYQKTLSILVALTGFSVFSGANAGTYTPLAASPTQVVTQSFTTLGMTITYSLDITVAAIGNLNEACLVIPLRTGYSGSTVYTAVPVIADGRWATAKCVNNKPINYSGLSPLLPGIPLATITQFSAVDLTNGRNITIDWQGMLDSYSYAYGLWLSNTGVQNNHVLRFTVTLVVPNTTIAGTYYWYTGSAQGIGVPYGVSYMNWTYTNFVNNVNTQTLNINGQSWNIACDITEQCNSQKISDIKNASSPSQVNTVNFSYTSTTAGSTCPAGFHGNLKYWKSNAPSFTPMTPGSGYSVTIATGEEIHIYYDVPKSPVACTLPEQITVNVSLP